MKILLSRKMLHDFEKNEQNLGKLVLKNHIFIFCISFYLNMEKFYISFISHFSYFYDYGKSNAIV